MHRASLSLPALGGERLLDRVRKLPDTLTKSEHVLWSAEACLRFSCTVDRLKTSAQMAGAGKAESCLRNPHRQLAGNRAVANTPEVIGTRPTFAWSLVEGSLL